MSRIKRGRLRSDAGVWSTFLAVPVIAIEGTGPFDGLAISLLISKTLSGTV